MPPRTRIRGGSFLRLARRDGYVYAVHMPTNRPETACPGPARSRRHRTPHPPIEAGVTRALGRLVINALLMAETPTTQRLETARAHIRLQRSARSYLALVKRAGD